MWRDSSKFYNSLRFYYESDPGILSLCSFLLNIFFVVFDGGCEMTGEQLERTAGINKTFGIQL